jgi:hypothetical protein
MLAKKSIAIVKSAMPAQLRASHACLGHALPAVQLVSAMSKQLAGKHIRLRAIMHTGTDGEMLESMATYGLEGKSICQILGGGYTHMQFQEWLDQQKIVEDKQSQEEKPSSSSSSPLPQ